MQRGTTDQTDIPGTGKGLNRSGISLLPVFLTTAFGLVLTAVLYAYFVAIDHDNMTERLQRGTNALIQAVTSPFPGGNPYFDTIFTAMDSLRDDLAPGEEVDQNYLDAHFWDTPPPGFESATVEYLPRVAFSERNELVSRFGDNLPADFRIRVQDGSGSRPAPVRDDYFPVMFEASGGPRTDSIGIDRGANALIRTALEQARDTGEFVTYGFYPLIGAGDQTMVTRFFYAIYATGGVPDTVDERREQLLGFVSLATIFDTEDFADLIPESYQGMEGAFMPLGDYMTRSRDPAIQAGLDGGTVLETTYQLPAEDNADWIALTRATPQLIDSMVTATRWWVSSIGLLFTMWAASMILWSRNYSLKVTKLVRQRTRELADRTESLSEVNSALRASETRYRMLADNATDIIFTCDLDGRCTYISPSVHQYSGFDVNDYIGQPVADCFTADSAVKLQIVLNKVKRVAAGLPETLDDNIIAEFGLRCRDGSVKPTESMISILQDDNGVPTGILGVSRDITERKKSEAERSALEEAYRQSQKMEAIGTLAGGVAHDFNNLLTGILGHAEMLKLKYSGDSDADQGLDVIEKAALRAKELTDQLLGFARKGRYQVVPVDLNDTIADLSSLMASTVNKNIELSVEPSDTPPIVSGDPGQLSQLFLNLVVNARDAMPKGGKLTMKTAVVVLDEDYCTGHLGGVSPGRYCEVTISDTGVGMTKDKMERIFEPFYSDKDAGAGTGMGLAMVYGVARNHGGVVTVESEPGVGSNFLVYLPYSDEIPAVGHGTGHENDLVRGEGIVLLVDDESMVRDMGTTMLETLGYRVITAEDGMEAVSIYQEQGESIDLAIIDIVMPKVDGIECLHALREIDPEVKVIMATGFSMDSVTERLDHGLIQGFLQKPFRMQELSKQLAAVQRQAMPHNHVT